MIYINAKIDSKYIAKDFISIHEVWGVCTIKKTIASFGGKIKSLVKKKNKTFDPGRCTLGASTKDEGRGGWQMRTPVLVLPVKGQTLRGRGKKWQN